MAAQLDVDPVQMELSVLLAQADMFNKEMAALLKVQTSSSSLWPSLEH